MDDCGKCRQSTDKRIRQAMGCGYEAPLEDARPWSPASMSGDWQGDETTCPGYTTRLPQVIETLRARVHWEKGSVESFCAGPPTEQQLAALEILEGAVNDVTHWAIQNPIGGKP